MGYFTRCQLVDYCIFVALKKGSTVRLKTLEIKGFKSFADKTVLRFDEGVTGVIGPNGCGKSNIIDSIRWVIGEHKISALRSENMSGLIFNGSKSRSASGLAEVSLTFENTRNLLPTEFSTVTVSRRYFKNGDSEYRLNDVACRLKDIHNLFMDTGVSTDSYAIIELGMVDDIIKDKDNSRRRMLEQAAGISIYKARKKEAKAKLDLTAQDLNRIEDLLFEINNNLKTLESQARKAERYYELKKQYKEVSVELAKASLEGFHQHFKELSEQQEAESDRKLQLDTEIATDEAALEKDKLAFTAQEKALQDMQRAFNELVNQIRTRENDRKLAEQQRSYLREQETKLQGFLSGADARVLELGESITFSMQQVEEEGETLTTMQEEAGALQELMDSREAAYREKKQALDQLREEEQHEQRRQFDAEKKAAVAETSVQNLQRSIRQIEEENAGRQEQVLRWEEEKEALEGQLEERREELQALSEQQEATKEMILSTQADIEALRDQMVDEARLLDARRNEHDLLKSLVDNLEGYPDSIKFLSKDSSWRDQPAPVLSDIIFCPEPYRAAIEGLLEPYLNYYVTHTLGESLRAIRLLDEHQKGKARFFVLEELPAPGEVAPAAEGLLPALSVVEVDDRYRPLIARLLGQVYIADDASAPGCAAAIEAGAVILEKSGRLHRGKYQVGGGSVGLFEGKKLGRAKNLDKLRAEIATLSEKVASLQTQIQEKHQLVLGYNAQLNEQRLNQLRAEVNASENQLFGLQNRMENYRQLSEGAARRLAEMQATLQQNEDQIGGVQAELAACTEKLEAVRRSIEEASAAYQDAEHQYNQVHAQYNNQNLQVTRQQSKVQALQQELAFKRRQLAELEVQITENHAQLEAATQGIAEAEQAIKTFDEELLELLRRRDEEEKTLNERDQAYYNFRNQVNERESALRQKQRQREQLDQLLGILKDKTNELKLQLAAMKERLQVEFRINLDDILDEQRSTEEDVAQLTESAERLKKRLDNMGEVNPTAIEAYQEMKKRYDFILEQKNDLVSARDSLLATIAEVENTANQKFLETFNQVKENFIKVFKTLFSEEDEADMIMSDPDNLADTGVEIIAKPKGKRPTAITQLSGGEKTLTATALLFAIYLIKPAPFCILDEVDAPLDDANVGKFTNMIRKFSENSQFIVVTHNKQTMAAVDVIYGVTMQEPGVSKLVAVDFRSLN